MTTCEIKLFWIKVTTFNKSKLAQKDELCTFECSLNGEDKEHCSAFFKRIWNNHKCYLNPIMTAASIFLSAKIITII
jgi:hypothetical protein